MTKRKKNTLVGLPVKDATSSIRLEILPSDIKAGQRKDNAHCAAANACIRQLGVADVRIHVARVYLRKAKSWLRYKTPRSLRTEIIAFDRGGSFEPSIHVLTPPPKYKRPNERGPNGSHKSTSAAAKRRVMHMVAGIRQHA